MKKLLSVKLTKKYQVLNICSSRPIYLKKFIRISERFSKKIDILNVPAHPADVYKTHGSNKKLLGLIKNIKFTRLENAIKKSVISYKKNKIFNQKN